MNFENDKTSSGSVKGRMDSYAGRLADQTSIILKRNTSILSWITLRKKMAL